METNNHRQAWYLARHLKHLSGNLAAFGFPEAAVLVGAAALSVGDRVARDLEEITFRQGGARHG